MKARLTILTMATVVLATLGGLAHAQTPRGKGPSPKAKPTAAPAAYFVGDAGSSQGYVHPSTASSHTSVMEGAAPAAHFAGSHAYFIGDVPSVAAASYGAPCASCGDGGCNGGCMDCGCCSTCRSTWGSVEYMLAWTSGRHAPPLVTTGTQAGEGVLGVAGTTILYPTDSIGGDTQTGGRLELGIWLKPEQTLGIGGRVWGLEGETSIFEIANAGTGVIAIPFFNSDPLVNAEDSVVLALPNGRSGGARVQQTNDVFSMDGYLRSLLIAGCSYRLDLIGGYQFARIDDDILIQGTTTQGATTFEFQDALSVKNEYNAGQIGVMGDLQRGRWTISALSKIGIGEMNSRIAIRGASVTTTNNNAVATNGGVFALGSMLGDFQRDRVVFSPEMGIKLNYAITDGLSLSAGYSLMYWSSVVLAGDLIDRNVNATQLSGGVLVGPDRPTLTIRDDDFWVQSVNFGFNWKY